MPVPTRLNLGAYTRTRSPKSSFVRSNTWTPTPKSLLLFFFQATNDFESKSWDLQHCFRSVDLDNGGWSKCPCVSVPLACFSVRHAETLPITSVRILHVSLCRCAAIVRCHWVRGPRPIRARILWWCEEGRECDVCCRTHLQMDGAHLCHGRALTPAMRDLWLCARIPYF